MTSKYQEYKHKAGQVDSLLEFLLASHQTVNTLRLADREIIVSKKNDGTTTIQLKG
jgi:hypothetical protein